MAHATKDYFATLAARFGSGWDRFWFTPSDTTPLGAIRLIVGLAALYVHASYTRDLVRLFGPEGMLPTEVVDTLRGETNLGFSYLNFASSSGELWTLHVLGFIVLAMFAAGLFSRVTSVLALIVTLSYIHRAPVLTSIPEPILTMLMFYLCLGPSGASYSLDRWLSWRNKSGAAESPAKSWTANLSLRLIQVHLAMIYAMMGIAMLIEPGDTWVRGEALWWLMARPEARLVDLTGFMAGKMLLLNFWTYSVIAFALAFAVLIWKPIARPLLLLISLPIWFGLALISGQVTFCVLMLAAGLAFAGRDYLSGVAESPAVVSS